MDGVDDSPEHAAHCMGHAAVAPEDAGEKGVREGDDMDAVAGEARRESRVDERPADEEARRMTLQRSLSVAADIVAGNAGGVRGANVSWWDAVVHTARLARVALISGVVATLLAFSIALLPWTDPCCTGGLGAGYYFQELAVYYTMFIAAVILVVQPAVQGGAMVGAGSVLTGVAWRAIFRTLLVPHTLPVLVATVAFYGGYQWAGVDMWFVGHQLFAYVLFFLSSVLVAHVTWRFVKIQGTLVIGTPRGSPGHTPPGSGSASDDAGVAEPPRRCGCRMHTRMLYMRAIVIASASGPAVIYVLVRLLRVYRGLDTDFLRALVRLLVYPALKALATIVVTAQARVAGAYIKAPPAAANLFVVAVIYFVSTFGRLLVLTLTDTATAIVVSALAAVVEIVVRGTHHVRTVAWITQCGRRPDSADRVRTFFANPRYRTAHADYASQSLLIEVSSAVIAAAMYLAYWSHHLLFDLSYDPGGAAPDVVEVFVVTAAQVIFELAAAVVGVWLEGRQNFDLPRVWASRVRPFLALHVLFAVEVVLFATTTFFVRPVASLCDGEFDICSCSHSLLHAERCGR